MNPWYPALAVVLALCCTSEARMRTWSALAISSLVGWFLPGTLDWSMVAIVAVYMAIDAGCAAMVLRHPAGLAQRNVGLGFAGMILFHCGFVLSPQHNWDGYSGAQSFVGWLQLASLFVWGAIDVVGVALVRCRPSRRQADRAARV